MKNPLATPGGALAAGVIPTAALPVAGQRYRASALVSTGSCQELRRAQYGTPWPLSGSFCFPIELLLIKFRF